MGAAEGTHVTSPARRDESGRVNGGQRLGSKGRAGQARAGQGWARQGRPGQGRARHTGQARAGSTIGKNTCTRCCLLCGLLVTLWMA